MTALSAPMSEQKIQHRAIEGLGLFDIAQVAGAFDQRHASARYAALHFARDRRGGEGVLVADDDQRRHGNFLQLELPGVVDRAGNGLEVRVLVQGRHAGDQPLETSGARRFAEQRVRDDRCDIARFLAGEQRFLAQSDEFVPLSFGQMAEAGHGVAQRQRSETVWIARGEIEGDNPTHREADEMGAWRVEAIEHPDKIKGEVTEIERPVVIVAIAVAARIPGDRMKAIAEGGNLVVPVGAVAADAVQENHERSGAGVIDCEARRPWDYVSRPCRHAATPRPASFPALAGALHSYSGLWQPITRISRRVVRR